MATREENLKKINEELEKLSDEELDQVAGGIKRPPTKWFEGEKTIPMRSGQYINLHF